MELLQPDIETCKRYLQQEMSDEERKEFETLAAENEPFRSKALANLKAIQMVGRKAIRQQIADAYRASEQALAKGKRKRMRFMSMAASVILILGIGLTWKFSPNMSMEKIFNSHYAFLKVDFRGGAEDQDSLWNVALDHYEDSNPEDLTKAVGLFHVLLADTSFPQSIHNQAYLYLGGACLELGWPNAAITAFKGVSASSRSFYGDAVWYTALAWISIGNMDSAYSDIKEIADDDRWSLKVREKAGEILEDLEDIN